MPKAKVNGVEVEFEAGMTVLQVAELAGEEIPRFCYHERLSIAGNCRMCLVEVKPGPPKPQASCALPAAEGQEIFTTTPMVKKAREGVMEFLLINHPLDCPICDQGGECDLQDEALAYGRDDSRYLENKRAVEEKFMGPVIKTIMTRCIQCTRCVRFATEIAGVSELGLINRGEDAEITTYLAGAVTSELSGNLADVCPVGALTHKPWAFHYRQWELKKAPSIDVMDAVGSNIMVHARGPEVMRILPRVKESLNEEWLADRSRYTPDGLMRQRLDKPYVRIEGRLREATWVQAFAAIGSRVQATGPERIGVIAGDLCAAEEMKAALDLFGGMGVTSLDCRQDGAKMGTGPRGSWLFNSTIAGIEEADAVLLIGTNPRREAPMINARLRKGWLRGEMRIGVIGPAGMDLNYGFEQLGDSLKALQEPAKKSPQSGENSAQTDAFLKFLSKSKAPAVIVGAAALARADAPALLNAIGGLNLTREGWNGFNVLHTAAARVGGLDLGFIPREGGRDVAGMVEGAEAGKLDVLFLLGADEIATQRLGSAFVVYLGSHGDAGAARADVILPGGAYTEKPGTYVNTEGRVQVAERVVFPKGEAKEDWAVLRALSEVLGRKLPYDTVEQLRERLIADHPTFGQIDHAPGAAGDFDPATLGGEGAFSADPIRPRDVDPYLTNPILRASVTMAELSALHHPAQRMAAE